MFFSGTGTITGKFDCGYLVTVKLGSEILRGVLYHPEEPALSDASPEPINALVPYAQRSRRRSGLRRRRSKRREDPNHPKPNRSGYNFFFAEKHCKFKSLYPNREREFTKMIGQSWSNLTAEERMVICKHILQGHKKNETIKFCSQFLTTFNIFSGRLVTFFCNCFS